MRPESHETLKRGPLLDLCIDAVSETTRFLIRAAKNIPATALRKLRDDNTSKPQIGADLLAEARLEEYLLRKARSRNIPIEEFFGEEKLGSTREKVRLAGKRGTFVLADALDGSDLYERAVGNWCCAAAIFTPTNSSGRMIEAVAVGTPEQRIYCASDDNDGAWMCRELPKPRKGDFHRLSIGEQNTKLEDASLCFYGQKAKKLCETAQTKLLEVLRGAPDARIYTLAGIPMIMKMIDPFGPRKMDAIVEFSGQQAHDIVPGAYIALKAGAKMFSPDGQGIQIQQLEEVMLNPNTDKLRYILSSSKSLAMEIVSASS